MQTEFDTGSVLLACIGVNSRGDDRGRIARYITTGKCRSI